MSDVIDLTRREAMVVRNAISQAELDRETMVSIHAQDFKQRINDLLDEYECVSVHMQVGKQQQIRAILLWVANEDSLNAWDSLKEEKIELAEKFKA